MKTTNTSTSFCIIPFISMVVYTDGTFNPCCIMKGQEYRLKKIDGTKFTIKDNIKEVWNSNVMKQIRLDMISGNKISGCNKCYFQENLGRASNRQLANNEWVSYLGEDYFRDISEQAIINNGEIDYNIVYLDLRLGNLCNLKCRMCNPYNSSQIAKEHIKLINDDPKYKFVWNSSYNKYESSFEDTQEWFDKNLFWDQIIELIPKLKKVYMTGGEPTLIKNNFRFMEECLRQGRKDIILFFNTNCTNVNKRFIELIKQFDRVYINASIDGVGVVNDYIRYPSKWDHIEKNIEKIAELKNVHLGITPTVQIYNIFNLTEILKWVDSLNQKYNRDIFIDFLINIQPKFLSVTNLSEDLRLNSLTDLLDYKKNNEYIVPLMTRNSIEGIIGLLRQPRDLDWRNQLFKFKLYTESLDKERVQSLKDINSILGKLLSE